ncbi:unnamed protein product [Phaedon cochleariae]|uniref:C2H2-type domain-containing protein n=1 Tax=Phaedon cochleariae TaxID=80249 RepID=A0A9N9SIU9_PHACE|nr:unnamed protein product [Phaedon cochleariae]
MICSICFKNEHIFDVNVDDKGDCTLLRKFRICVPEVIWDKSFKLCVQCEHNLERTYDFKELCINSYTSWKNIECVPQNNVETNSDNENSSAPMEEPDDDFAKAIGTKNDPKNENTTVIKNEKYVDNERTPITVGVKKTDNGSTCTLCGTTLTNKYLLRRHIQNVHATEKKYRCEMCQRAFTSAVYLSAHKRYHTGIRSHICSTCGKGFITASDLYHHEKIHANKRAYRCETCPKAFNTSSDLHKHKICVHLDRSLWKYACTLCERKFPLKINLDSHIMAHRGEKNFSCHLCDRKCITKSVLQNHIQTHSNILTLVCGLCSQTYKYKKSLNHHMVKAHGIGNVVKFSQSTKKTC